MCLSIGYDCIIASSHLNLSLRLCLQSSPYFRNTSTLRCASVCILVCFGSCEFVCTYVRVSKHGCHKKLPPSLGGLPFVQPQQPLASPPPPTTRDCVVQRDRTPLPLLPLILWSVIFNHGSLSFSSLCGWVCVCVCVFVFCVYMCMFVCCMCGFVC